MTTLTAFTVQTLIVLGAVENHLVDPEIREDGVRYFRDLNNDLGQVADIDTEVINWMIDNYWIVCDSDWNLTITERGQGELTTHLFILDVLDAIHDGRAYPTAEYEGRELMFAFDPVDPEDRRRLAQRKFAAGPLAELGEVELDEELTPHLAPAGLHRLVEFGVLTSEHYKL